MFRHLPSLGEDVHRAAFCFFLGSQRILPRNVRVAFGFIFREERISDVINTDHGHYRLDQISRRIIGGMQKSIKESAAPQHFGVCIGYTPNADYEDNDLRLFTNILLGDLRVDVSRDSDSPVDQHNVFFQGGAFHKEPSP